MQTSTLIILIIIIGLISLNIYIQYKSRQEFECPDCTCPECPPEKKCLIPSNKAVVDYLVRFFIDPLLKLSEPKEFMDKNMIFSDAREIGFAEDYEKVFKTLKNELLENRFRFNELNLRYMYPPNQVKEKEFVELYKITNFPSPLVTFKDTNLLIGYVDTIKDWKIFINNNVYLKNNDENE